MRRQAIAVVALIFAPAACWVGEIIGLALCKAMEKAATEKA